MYLLKNVSTHRGYDLKADVEFYSTYEEAAKAAANQIMEEPRLDEIIDEWADDNDEVPDLSVTTADIPDTVGGALRDHFVKIQWWIDNAPIGVEREMFFDDDRFYYHSSEDPSLTDVDVGRESYLIEFEKFTLCDDAQQKIKQLDEENDYLRDLLTHKMYKPGSIGSSQALKNFETYLRKRG